MKLGVSLALAGLLACHPELPPSPPPCPADCAGADARLTALGCPEARTPEGTSFRVACERITPRGLCLPTACIVRASSCAEARSC